MHTCKLAPPILTFRDSVLKPLQFLRHGAEPMDFSSERGVVEATNHSVCLVLAFCPLLEHLELLGSVHRFPIVVEDGRGVQGFRVYLVAIIPQPDNDRVGVEYDLHILRLPGVAVRSLDGERDEVVPVVRGEPKWDFISFESIASLV